MMNKTILMLSVSCMSFIAGADLCYAGFNPDDTPPVLSAAMLKSHVSTHTSHLTAAHLSSLEDFAELTLSESSGLSLPKNLGNYLFYPLPENSGRGWGGFHNTPLTQLAAACFVTDTTDCSGNEFGGNNADDNDGGVPPGGDDYDLDNDKRCIEEGFISKNASLPARVITLLARNHILASVRLVTANMLPVNARPAAQVMTTPPFPKAMFRTERLVWIATVRPSIKSNPIPATDIWTAAPWAPKPEQRPACRGQRPCMTIVRPART